MIAFFFFAQLVDSSTLAFWSKTPVDIEPRRIRLQSNSYTASTLLDIVTAATVQVWYYKHNYKSRDFDILFDLVYFIIKFRLVKSFLSVCEVCNLCAPFHYVMIV